MSAEKEQHECIKFCIKFGKHSTETFEMLKTAFGDECLSHGRTFEWFKRFKKAELQSMTIRDPGDQQAEMVIL
jgi:hypothetical protein